MQKEQLQGSNVIPERHVWLQRYTLQQSSVPNLQTTLTTVHQLGQNRTLNNQNLNYRDSNVLCTILSGIWRYIFHFLFCNYSHPFQKHCFDTQKTQWKQLIPTSHLFDLINFRKWHGSHTPTGAEWLWQLNAIPWHKKQAVQFFIFLKDFIPLI